MAISTTNTVSAALTYFVPPADGSKAYIYVNRVDPKTGERERNGTTEEHEALIENIRGKEDSVSLDTTGFQFYRAPQKYTAFSNDEEIAQEYYPESIELVKKLTGASRIVPFDHSAYPPLLLTAYPH